VSQQLGAGSDVVAIRSADSLVRDGLPSPTFLKVDIEGAEAGMRRGAADALATVEVMTVAVHDQQLYEQCVSILQHAGFDVHQDVRIRHWIEEPTRWEGDPDLVAVRAACARRARDIANLPQFERTPPRDATP
jgi:hypothetical protein